MVTSNRRFKDDIYEQFARIGKAVSSPKRLELLDLICQGEHTVETLAKETGLSLANASQHLQVLHSARLVESEKKGLYVIYQLADQSVYEFYHALRTLAESRLAEVEQITRRFLEGKEGMEPVDREKLLESVRNGSVTVLDVRPEDEYRYGHIPHAISIPLKELAIRISELPRDREIVAYCRGPYCVLAIEAVELLRKNGFQAVRLDYSFQEWHAFELPLEAGKEF